MSTVDIRWKQRFENLHAAFLKLKLAIETNQKTPYNELIQMALIKAFEMTFELSWKTLKDFLKYNGIDVNLPREVIKSGFSNDIIAEGQLWIDMLENRNLMTHTYNQALAKKAVNDICSRYWVGLLQLHDYFSARL